MSPGDVAVRVVTRSAPSSPISQTSSSRAIAIGLGINLTKGDRLDWRLDSTSAIPPRAAFQAAPPGTDEQRVVVIAEQVVTRPAGRDAVERHVGKTGARAGRRLVLLH